MRAPVLFVVHSAPSLADDRSAYAEALSRHGALVAAPAAVIAVCELWRTPAPVVTAAAAPELLGGAGAFRLGGSAQLAHRVAEQLGGAVDRGRGLDEGVWLPLRRLFGSKPPRVVQVSLPKGADPPALLSLGRSLAAFRDEGVAIVGTGAIARGRPAAAKGAATPDWARAFDEWVAARVAALDLPRLLDFRREAPGASQAAPGDQALASLFVVLGAARPGDQVTTFHHGFDHGTLSLRCFELSPKGAGSTSPIVSWPRRR
jgi:4,5-DOPA dioxygenase extradiol